MRVLSWFWLFLCVSPQLPSQKMHGETGNPRFQYGGNFSAMGHGNTQTYD